MRAGGLLRRSLHVSGAHALRHVDREALGPALNACGNLRESNVERGAKRFVEPHAWPRVDRVEPPGQLIFWRSQPDE
jgi:hypothetical protein